MQFESQPSDISHRVTHTWLTDASKRSSHLSYSSKEEYEPFQQQWVSLIVAHHSISSAEKVPKIWLFLCNLRVNLQIYHTVWPILGWQVLSKAPPISLIHQRKDMKHFICNGCISLQHSTPYPMLRGYPNLAFLCTIWVSTLAHKYHTV